MNVSVIDKSGFLAKIKVDSMLCPIIEFGCGVKKINPEFIGIDLIDSSCVDIVGDAFDILSEFPNSSISGIHANHFIEHVSNLGLLLSEFARVLKPNGYIVLTAPHFSNPFFYSDPTHKFFFGLYSMSYFAHDKILSRKVPSYSIIDGLSLRSVKLNFKSLKPRYFRHLLLKSFGILFNFNNWSRELYEEIFSKIIPCYEVVYNLRKSDY